MPISADNPLGLRIPEQSLPDVDSMVQPRDFEAWIQRLPTASGSQMAKRLLKAIQGINRTRIPPRDRIRIAELFTQPIAYATSSQERKFIDSTLPLSEKRHLIARICIRLYEELAIAYKLVVHDVAMDKIGNQERKILILALFRAACHLADTLYRSTLIYNPPPRHLWRELNNLFVFAETNKWSTSHIKNPGAGDTETATLRELYLQVLLFAASAPHRFESTPHPDSPPSNRESEFEGESGPGSQNSNSERNPW